MKCRSCKNKLNPYLLRQAELVEGNLVFEVECPNCCQRNNISAMFYFELKKDWDMPTVQPINNKMPSEMNVIFVSMERCGISWIIHNLSHAHEEMFNEPIPFIPEISYLLATRERFDLPEGWINVYDVDPHDLLLRGYDRIVVVHRDLETLLKVYELYYPPDLTEKQKAIFLKKAKENYQKVYGVHFNNKINKKILWLNLDDLNRYTVSTVKELMTFLNFPERGRPNPWVIKPPDLRNWEAYSSVLPKGQKVCDALERIANQYTLRDGLLEYTGNLRNEKKRIILENILIIGPRIHKRCHMSENIYYAFRELGYNAELVPGEMLLQGPQGDKNKLYGNHTLSFPLSKTLKYCKKKPELILLDEPAMYFYNDVNIPVFYIHREFRRPPKVNYPDIVLFWNKATLRYFKQRFAPHWMAQIPKAFSSPPAVDLDVYKPMKKTISGISNIAGREKISDAIDMKELAVLWLIYETRFKIEYVTNLGIKYIDNGEGYLSDEEYREIIPICEAVWVLQPAGQYISRRMLECMACKTVVFLKLENKEHEDILRDMGLEKGVHYVNVNNLSELKKLNESFRYDSYPKMIEKAYDVVTKNHTFYHRAEFIIELYREWFVNHKGVFVE